MTRPLRVEYPGAYYHVINRGNAGENLFETEGDKEQFLEYLQKAGERFSLIIHTYCLMTNHYHLLVETPHANLGRALQWLNVSYAVYYNNNHHRSGHLFQGRFKAILIDADEYLKELSRYIHLNPVQAKIVAKPEDYAWSSYPGFIGKVPPVDWLTTGKVLEYFGKKRKEAIKSYKKFVEGIDPAVLENPNKKAVGGFILGSAEFVNWVKEAFLSPREDEKEIPELRKLKPKVSLERILQVVRDECGGSEEEIREKGRKGNQSREIVIYLARELCGISGKELGSFFGGISGAGITMRYNQLSRVIGRDKVLREKVNKLRELIFNI